MNWFVTHAVNVIIKQRTSNGSLKKHVESINESSTPVMDVTLKEQQKVFLINM